MEFYKLVGFLVLVSLYVKIRNMGDIFERSSEGNILCKYSRKGFNLLNFCKKPPVVSLENANRCGETQMKNGN